MKVSKLPLPLDSYEAFEINQSYSAFEVIIDGISQNDIDDYEYQYINQGYKVFSSQISHANEGLFSLKIIIAKLEYTF